MTKYHHTTFTTETCKICGKPFLFFWYDKEEKNGQSETAYRYCHKSCLEKQTGKKCKTLHEINEERKKLK